MKGCKSKFIGVLGLIVVLTLSFGLYYRWSQIQEVSAVNIIRKVIPGGPVFWMAHEGDYVAGVGTAENNHDETALYLYDTQGTWADFSDDTYTIIDQVEGSISHIIFQDNHITWLDNTGWSSCSAMTLKAYNIATSSTTIISNQIADYIYGRDDNKVVYQYVVPNGRNIAMYDLITQQTTIICDAPGFQRNPRIKVNIIIWEDERNPQTNTDIYMYNLSTQTETLVAEDVGEYFSDPITNGSYVVFYNSQNQEIIKYNVLTNASYIVASTQSDRTIVHFGLNSDFLFWGDLIKMGNQTSNDKIYMHDLSLSQDNVLFQSTNNNQFTRIECNEEFIVFSYGSYSNYGVKGINLSNFNIFDIRTVGKTYTTYLHPTENSLLMCSKGTGMNPIEWDISFVLLP